MRTVVKEYKVYKFNELCEESQNKVINDYVNSLAETVDFSKLNKNSNLYKAYKKANEMQTIWFLGSYIWEYCRKQILKEVNEYEYLENGRIFCMLNNE